MLVLCMLALAVPTAFAEPTKTGDVEFTTHEITLAVNEERNLYLKSWPAGGVIWETDNSSVAYVIGNGVLRAVGIGIAHITVTSEDTGNTDVAKVIVTDHYAIYDSFDWSLENWTVVDYDGDGYSWMLASDFEEPIQTLGYDAAFCASYLPSEGALSSDDYLISKPFSIPFDAKTAELRFTAGALFPNAAYEELFVYIGTGWADINDILACQPLHIFYDVDYDEFILNMDEFIGEDNIFVAFRYLNIDTYGLWLDNVGVYYEYEKIDEIVITNADIKPVIGDRAGDHTYYTIPSDVHYYEDEHPWYNYTDNCFMQDDDVFEANTEYEAGWLLISDIGYEFTPDCKVTVNGETLFDWDYTYVITAGYEYEIWTAPITAVEPQELTVIPKVDIEGVNLNPNPGEKAGDYIALSCAQPVSLTDVAWFCDSTGEYISDVDVFEEGKSYSLGLFLLADNGYKFTDETEILINGSDEYVDKDYTEIKNNTLFEVWSVNVLCEQHEQNYVDTITLNDVTTAPPVGGKAGDYMNVTIPEGEHYKVVKVSWYNSTNHVHLGDTDEFEANTLYSIGISLVPTDGYKFAADVKILINGSSSYVDLAETIIGENSVAVWTVDTESTDAPPVMLGDCNRDGKINTADAVQVLKFAAEMITLDETQSLCADVNFDHKVNTADAVLILKYAAGMISWFV